MEKFTAIVLQAGLFMERKFELKANTLKLIAISAMLVDHIGYAFLPMDGVLWIIFRCIGRIAAPIIFFFIVEGYHRTKNINKYMFRLFVFALISYIPYIYLFHETFPITKEQFLNLNVLYTLLIGLIFIRVFEELKNPLVKIPIMIILLILSTVGDWNYIALLLMLTFHFYYGNYKNQAFTACIILLFNNTFLVTFLSPFFNYVDGVAIDLSIYRWTLSELGMFFSIFLLRFYNGQKGNGGKIAKYSFYLFYPIHLLAICLIRYIVFR